MININLKLISKQLDQNSEIAGLERSKMQDKESHNNKNELVSP